MEPSVILTGRWVDPPDTFRASAITDMFDMTVDTSALAFTYDVGIVVTRPSIPLKIRNRTFSHDLAIKFILPTWLTTDMATDIILARGGTTFTLALTLNESDVKEKSKTFQRQFADDVFIAVAPLQVTGPVYVLRSLPSIT